MVVVEVVVVVVAFVGRETGIPKVPAASFGDSIGEAGGPSNRSRCGFSLSFIKDQKAYLRRVTVLAPCVTFSSAVCLATAKQKAAAACSSRF